MGNIKSKIIFFIVIICIITGCYAIYNHYKYDNIRNRFILKLEYNFWRIETELEDYIKCIKANNTDYVLQLRELSELKKHVFMVDSLMDVYKYSIASLDDTNNLSTMWRFTSGFIIYIQKLEGQYVNKEINPKDLDKIARDLKGVRIMLSSIESRTEDNWKNYLKNFKRTLEDEINKDSDNEVFNQFIRLKIGN